MYTQLLGFALDEHDDSDLPLAVGALRAELLRCRLRLLAEASSSDAIRTVTDQLAYDVALVGLAERLGIAWELGHFDQPVRERHSLERAVVARGIPLADTDG